MELLDPDMIDRDDRVSIEETEKIIRVGNIFNSGNFG
jgi:hypothetical protein